MLLSERVPELKMYVIGETKSRSFNDMDLSLYKKESRIKFLGRVSDVQLVKLYSNACAFIFPSFYEGFGIPVLEAQACGCIPVSFGNSGQADIIRHKENGFLADYLSADSLAEGIRWGISEARTAISKENMRSEVFRKYSGEVVAKQYLNLYQNLIKRKVTQ